jgi:hypothetical protein
VAAFVIGSGPSLLYPIVEPWIAGSHGFVYTEAARAWLAGGNPWAVGPPFVIFSGPPTMLLPYVPFVLAPDWLIRVAWIGIAGGLAIWSIRRLGLPGYWIGFPPIFSAIVLGHPETLVLALLVAGGAMSGLAAVLKPYAALALLAERRWPAFALAAAVVVATALVLPWPRFFAELPDIGANLQRQATGDSVFGNVLLMAVAALALAGLGVRRGLWLAAPVLWPAAQPLYKAMSVPRLSPLLGIAWALPLPGATLAGLVAEAVLVQVDRRRRLPAWLARGVGDPRPPGGAA